MHVIACIDRALVPLSWVCVSRVCVYLLRVCVKVALYYGAIVHSSGRGTAVRVACRRLGEEIENISAARRPGRASRAAVF